MKWLFLPKLQSFFAEFLLYGLLAVLVYKNTSTFFSFKYGEIKALFLEKANSYKITSFYKIFYLFVTAFQTLKYFPIKKSCHFFFRGRFKNGYFSYIVKLYAGNLRFTTRTILYSFLLIIPTFFLLTVFRIYVWGVRLPYSNYLLVSQFFSTGYSVTN